MVTNEAVCRHGVDATLRRAWREKTPHTSSTSASTYATPLITVSSLKLNLRETEGLLPQWQVNKRERLFD